MRPLNLGMLAVLVLVACTASTSAAKSGLQTDGHDVERKGHGGKREITVYGQILKHGKGVKYVLVDLHAANKFGRYNQRLGQARTNALGFYRIRFMPKYDKYPDVYIQVGRKRSAIYRNANGNVRINLRL